MLCAFLVLNCTLPVTADSAVAPSIHEINHRSYEELKMYSGYSFTDDREMYFYNNDMFYNVSDNTYRYNRWSKGIYSYLAENADGTFTRVEPLGWRVHYSSATGSWYYDEATGQYVNPGFDNLQYTGPDGIAVENYSKDLTLLSEKIIDMPLPLFGGFFSGKDYNFVVVGQENPDASDSAEVVRFLKYSKSWELLDSCSVYGANTTIPFDAGCVRMTETAGKLYAHTCHEMYSGHQANMTFVLDEADFTIKEQSYRVWNISSGYVSHSFNQFIVTDGTNIYRVDHGDAHPRSVVVVKSAVDGSIESTQNADAFSIKQGSTGDNDTGVCVGGVALGDNNIIIAGGTEDQENSENFGNNKRNIFLSVVSKDLRTVKLVMLTSYGADTDIRTYTPQLVKTGENSFLVMWEEYDTVKKSVTTCCVGVDENGNAITDVVRQPIRLSDCQPILCSDGTVKWYVSTGKNTVAYSIPAANPGASFLCGDVDGDGVSNCYDAALILRCEVGLADKPLLLSNGDANSDGKVDNYDATLILQYEVALIDSLPVRQ